MLIKRNQNINDLPKATLEQISHFFERYKDLEAGKWAKVTGYGDKAKALEVIKKSIIS